MKSRVIDIVVLSAAFLGLAWAVFGDSLALLSTHFLGIEYVDHHGTQWFYWFAEQTLLHGASPLHTDLFFYPWGKDILRHTGANMLDAYLSIPFIRIFGRVLGYNLFVFAGLALSALAVARLARQVTDDLLAIGAAVLAAFFLPYALMELVEGRPTQAFLLLPALFLAEVLRTGRQPGLKAPLLAGLWLALCGYQYWYYAFFGGMAALAHGLWLTAFPPAGAGSRAAILGRHAVMAGAAALLVAPLAVPIAMQMGDMPGLLQVDAWGLSGAEPTVNDDMRIGLLLWEPFRSSTGFFVQDDGGEPVFLHRTTWTAAALLPFLLLALIKPGRLSRGAWVAMLLLVGSIAVGPVLLVGPYGLPNLVYIGIVKLIGPLQRLWWPGRAYAFVALLMLVGLATSMAWIRQRGGAWLQRVALVLFTVGTGWHLHTQQMLPYPTWDATVPAGFRCLAQGPEGAVLELPYSWTQAHLYYQTAHGRPLLGGMIENNPVFTPDELTTLREENTFVARLIAIAGGGIEQDTADAEVQPAHRQEFIDLGYRYVLLQEDALVIRREERSMLDNALRTRARSLRRELNALLGLPVYDDARISIYDLHGEGSPCAADPPAPDTRAVGRNVTAASDLVAWDPRSFGVKWVFGGGSSGEDASEDATGEGTGEGTTPAGQQPSGEGPQTEGTPASDPRRLLWGADEADGDALDGE